MRMRKLLLATLLAAGTLVLMPAAASAQEQPRAQTAKLPEANRHWTSGVADSSSTLTEAAQS